MKKYIILLSFIFMTSLFAQGISDEAMQEAIEMAAPGAEHEWLSDFTGDWSLDYKFYPAPGADPIISSGDGKAEMILGNRFLKLTSTGTIMGLETETLTILGFDKRFKKYTLDGYDTMGTYAIHAEGDYDTPSTTIDFKGSNYEPSMDSDIDYTMSFIFDSENSYKVELYFHIPGMDDYKMMEFTAKRK